MSSAPFLLARLNLDINRSGFKSGKLQLDNYFHNNVSRDVKAKYATCWTVTHIETNNIAGYYTLAATTVDVHAVPEEMAKKLPRYPAIPAFLLGRLAVDQRYQRQGVGPAMLADALVKATSQEIPAHAMIVDALDADAKGFYLHYDFKVLDTESEAKDQWPLRMFMKI